MSEISRSYTRRTGAVLLALSLFAFASGCKKKVPPPPPPPPPARTVDTTPPPPTAPPARVVINSFAAEPSRIEKGQPATLRWSISNATDMTIEPNLGAVQSQGSRQVFPSSTTTYTLTAKGPGGTDSRSVSVEVVSAAAPPPPPPVTPTLSSADMLSREGQDAFFDYDKSDIRPDAQQALTNDAELLKRIFAKDSSVSIVIEGHCDERGSAAYNLGLGDRRATAAKTLLIQLGVPAERLQTRSFGNEHPQCTEATEECYQKNRRAHLVPGQ